MKKLLVFLLIICVITISMFCLLNYFEDSQGVYPNGGRDTHIQFGDGRFVILSGDYLVLYDRSEEEVYKKRNTWGRFSCVDKKQKDMIYFCRGEWFAKTSKKEKRKRNISCNVARYK